MNYSNVFDQDNPKSAGGGLAAFDAAEAAPEYSPVPPGVYTARVLKGEFTTNRKGEDAYKLRFEIAEGEHAGKTVIRTWTFTPKALPYTKRDLSPFGLTSSAALLSPFPPAGRKYLVRLVVALQRGDDGREFNDIKKIDIIRVDESPVAAFMLPPRQSEGGPK
jgi:hypothetical protein